MRLLALLSLVLVMIMPGNAGAAPTPLTFTDTATAVVAGDNFIPSTNGRNLSGLVNGQGYTQEQIWVDVSNYAPTDTIIVTLQFSDDNWKNDIYSGGSTTSNGGVHLGRDGGSVPGIGFQSQFPPNLLNAGNLRQRIIVTVPSANTLPLVELILS